MTEKKISHDETFKLMFGVPQATESLVVELVPSKMTGELDFSTMQCLNNEYVVDIDDGNGLKKSIRQNDMIWKIRRKDGSNCYIVLMLEFQSTVFRRMALRILLYSGHLLENLAVREEMSESDPLPWVCPIVLYNGRNRWTAPTNMLDLFEKRPELDPSCLPLQNYFVIDEGHLPKEELYRGRGLAVLWMRAKRAETVEELQAAAEAFMTEARRLSGDGMLWKTLLSCLAPYVDEKLGREVNWDMLQKPEEYVMSIRDEMKQLRDEGKAEGRLEGKAEGRAEGWLEGRAEGNTEGIQTALLTLLEFRFGNAGTGLSDRIRKITDTGMLSSLIGQASQASRLEDFESLLAPVR